MVNRILKYISYLLATFIALSLLWLIFSAQKRTNELKTSVEKHVELSVLGYSRQIAKQMIKKINSTKTDIVQILQKDKNLQKECNQKLELLRSSYIPYIYILWLDKKGRFRFLCDGSKEKSHFFQKFDIENKELWQKIYKSGKPKIIGQKKYEGLWKSLLYPIKALGKTQAMVVVDYSVSLPNSIGKIVKPYKKLLQIILIAMFLLVIIVFVEILHILAVRKKSFTDPLTGIYNREFLKALSKKLYLPNYDLLIIDIDHFKKVNDTYGHLVGDKVLKHITKSIKSSISIKDYLFRFGGEEFLVLLFNPKKDRNAFLEAQKIRLNLSSNPLNESKFGKIYVKMSIGIYDNIKQNISFEVALREADKALYNAKKAGRNCVAKADTGDISIPKESHSFSDIRSFIDSGNVFCQFQPIFLNSKEKKIAKYEVLARLKDNKGNVLMPGDFLSIIWKTNIYHRFTKQVINYSINTFKNKKEKFSINLSLQDILDEKIMDIIEEFAKKEPETISRMGIEILEYDRFDNIQRLQTVINRLKKHGIAIILDDFGSGHANFAIIEKLDIDELKIDGSIVQNINKNYKSKIFLETLAHFAKKSSIKTTVEFISSKEIFDTIVHIPFTYLQGYYLGKPKELKAV